MQIWSIVLIVVLASVVIGCIIGIASGKHAVKKALNQTKPILSLSERIVYSVLICGGVACILAGIFYTPKIDQGLIEQGVMGEQNPAIVENPVVVGDKEPAVVEGEPPAVAEGEAAATAEDTANQDAVEIPAVQDETTQTGTPRPAPAPRSSGGGVAIAVPSN